MFACQFEKKTFLFCIFIKTMFGTLCYIHIHWLSFFLLVIIIFYKCLFIINRLYFNTRQTQRRHLGAKKKKSNIRLFYFQLGKTGQTPVEAVKCEKQLCWAVFLYRINVIENHVLFHNLSDTSWNNTTSQQQRQSVWYKKYLNWP